LLAAGLHFELPLEQYVRGFVERQLDAVSEERLRGIFFGLAMTLSQLEDALILQPDFGV
jgi:hypothetical protein